MALGAGSWLAGIAALLLWAATAVIVGPGASIVVASAGVVVAGVAAATCASRGNGLRLADFRLAAWYPGVFAVSFGVTSLAWRQPQGGSAAPITQESVLRALVVAGASLLPWVVGYLVGPGPVVRRVVAASVRRLLPEGPLRLRTPHVALALYALGWVGRLLRLATGRYAYLGDPSAGVVSASGFAQPLALLELFARFALIVAAIDVVWSRGRRSRRALTIMIAVELAVGLYGGMKSEFVLTIAPLLVVATASKRRLPVRWIVAASIAFLFLLSFNAQYRSQVRTSSYALSLSDAVPLVPHLLVQTVVTSSPRSLLVDGPAKLGGRLREIDNIAIILQKTPSTIPHAGIRPIVFAPVIGVVPRLLWPAKPLLLTGYDFAQEYYGLTGLYTSSAVTVVGDLYRHAGFPAVALGMLLLGGACRLVDDELHPARDLRLAVLFVPLFATLTNVEAGVVAAIAGLPLLLAQAAFVCRLAFGTARLTVPAARPALSTTGRARA